MHPRQAFPRWQDLYLFVRQRRYGFARASTTGYDRPGADQSDCRPLGAAQRPLLATAPCSDRGARRKIQRENRNVLYWRVMIFAGSRYAACLLSLLLRIFIHHLIVDYPHGRPPTAAL